MQEKRELPERPMCLTFFARINLALLLGILSDVGILYIMLRFKFLGPSDNSEFLRMTFVLLDAILTAFWFFVLTKLFGGKPKRQ